MNGNIASVTWSFRNHSSMQIHAEFKHFFLLSMLKTVVLLNIISFLLQMHKWCMHQALKGTAAKNDDVFDANNKGKTLKKY